MALAEARAAWQRTANRCLVQEDAKRAPKLACCSSLPHSVKQADAGPTNVPGGQDIPSTGPQPFNRNPSFSNLSPNSRWWLQLQPNYGYQKTLMDEQCKNPPMGNIENCQMQESIDDPGLIDQTTYSGSSYENQCNKFTTCAKKDFGGKEDVGELRHEGHFGCGLSKNSNELYFDSESSWIGAEKNIPWWRTADTEELALLVAQRSFGLIENCDLPRPQHTSVKKDPNVNMYYYGCDEIFSTSPYTNPGIGGDHHKSTCAYVPAGMTAKSSCRKIRMTAETEFSGAHKLSRDGPTRETHASDDDASKGQLMEALRHSQTRAREAETVAKQACAEKEHVVRLVIRQASQLFAYKQWIQLENMYIQFINSKTTAMSKIFPVMLPQRSRKTRKSYRRKRSRPWYDVGKYAVVLALGLGLVGAGFLLGWTVGWMLPTW